MGDLVFSDVSFGYGSHRILDGFGLTVRFGEVTALMGPSGCGKTTLFRLISGSLPVSTGEVRLDGERIDGFRKDVATVYQDYDALPWFTVRENLLKAARRSRADIDALLRDFSLQDAAQRFPAELSGGMRKRLSLARCAALHARVFLLDEAFASLDLVTRREAYANIVAKLLAPDSAVLMITHDVEEVLTIADRVVVFGNAPLGVKADIPVPGPRDVQARLDWLQAGSEDMLDARSHLIAELFR